MYYVTTVIVHTVTLSNCCSNTVTIVNVCHRGNNKENKHHTYYHLIFVKSLIPCCHGELFLVARSILIRLRIFAQYVGRAVK